MMDIVVLKLLGVASLFLLMLVGVLAPLRLLQADAHKARRCSRVLALSNTFAGGVFLATCFNGLLPTVREKVEQVFQELKISSDIPLAETMMMVGFFLTVLVEQLVLTFRKDPPAFIDLETFNTGGSEVGSDSEYDTPFISPHSPSGHGHHHGGFLREGAGGGGLRLFSLAVALSAHSVFEGLALGLQEDAAKLGGLFVGVAIHETLAGVALGVSLAKSSLPMRDTLKVALVVSLTIPLGIVLGLGVQSVQGIASGLVSLVLQGLAAGTFLFVVFFEILSHELEDKQDRLLKVLVLVMGYSLLAAVLFIKW